MGNAALALHLHHICIFIFVGISIYINGLFALMVILCRLNVMWVGCVIYGWIVKWGANVMASARNPLIRQNHQK